MSKTVKVPVLGQSVEEVRIVQWLKNVGDTVQIGDTLGEIETDKTNMEFVSTESGVILSFLAPVDSYVRVEAPMVLIGEPGEAVNTPLAESTSLDVSPRARRLADEKGVALKDLVGKGTGPGGRIIERDIAAASPAPAPLTKASPLAHAIAVGEGVNLAAVAGSGAGGRITADDVRAVASPVMESPSTPALASEGARKVVLAGLRKRVADNLSKSVREKPHVTLNTAVDMTEATRLRTLLLPELEKSDKVRLSPTDLIVKACAKALLEHPRVNAHLDGDTITFFDTVHIGLAVSLGDEGLIVPVIKRADDLSISGLARAANDLAERARTKQLKPDEVAGGTFTITNPGVFGGLFGTPIINQPQVAILGVGKIEKRAKVLTSSDGEDYIAIRHMAYFALSFDHRIIDGADAERFLAHVKEQLEGGQFAI